MVWNKLNSPDLKAEPCHYSPFDWPDGVFIALPAIDEPVDIGVLDLLEHRRTRRIFGPLTEYQLGQLLWRCAHTQAIAPSDYGFELEHRPTPSAGAIHPIHILIKPQGSEDWYRYDGRRHGLVEILGAPEHLKHVYEQSQTILPAENATHVLMVAEPGKTSAKYENCESLVWRDTGALIAVMAIIAEALNLSFCPLGITGEPWASKIAPPGVLVGVGVALAGGATS